jgi:NADH-quinone oxidoreductase subunit L
MAAIVGVVGAVVVVYATGYFAEHDRASAALSGLLFFLAAMQGLVLADGFLPLLIFWEIVGAMSARLIAFSREDPTAPGGAVRAFLTTRSADLGLYLAVFALFAATGSLEFTADRPGGALGALIGIGLVVAAMGKSAQAPLNTWLTAAMAGPTPVSALLHSATMVAAGVYLLVRNHDLLAGWPLEVAGWVGAVTAVAGAAIALAQNDLKRVLAGSTTSQLGLMFVGAAAGGPTVAIFHLAAHAAGKATLFLVTGVFQHRRGTTALDDLAGAGRDDRAAFAIFAVGAASIAGVPPLAAFWSKEAIVAAAEDHPAWVVLVLVAAAGSAAYLLRPMLRLWRGPSRGSQAVAGRTTMLAAAAILAGASLVLGAAAAPLGDLLAAPPPDVSAVGAGLALAALVVGVAAVLLGARAAGPVVELARRELRINDVLRALAVRPVLAAAAAAAWFERRVVDAAVDGLGRTALRIASRADRVERAGIDAAVDGLARMIGRSGDDLRRLQSGRLYEYLRDTVAGAAAVALLIAITALT